MRARLGGLLSLLTLSAVALTCFARLVNEPGGLIVDGETPSVDHARWRDARVLGNDLTRLFLPHHLQAADQVSRFGRPSFWDPRGFGGRPSVGNPQAGLFYPPVWLAWWSRSPSALGWLTVGHLLWGGIGVSVLLRSQGLGRLAATIGGAVFLASPYVLAQTFEGHYPHVWSVSWYPWAFWSALGLRRGDVRRAWALPMILALSFLAGHPQEWFYLIVTLGLWAVADAVLGARSLGGTPTLRVPCLWVGVFLVTMGLIAVELVPDVVVREWTLRERSRAVTGATRYHLNVLNALQLLSPTALGGPADYFGHENYWESVLSIGWAPLALAATALARSSRRGLVRGWAVVATGAIVFAAGESLGLCSVFTAVVPGLSLFRVPARSLFLATLASSALAGVGVETLASAVVDRRAWSRDFLRAAVVVAVLPAIGSAIPERRVSNPAPVSMRKPPAGRWRTGLSRLGRDPVFLGSLVATTMTALWLGKQGKRVEETRTGGNDGSRRRCIDVLPAAAFGLIGLIELSAHGHALLKIAPASRFLGDDPISDALTRIPHHSPYRIRALDDLYDDLRAGRHGFEKTNVNDSFQIRHAAELYEPLYRTFEHDRPIADGGPMAGPIAEFHRQVRRRELDLMAVEFLVADRPEPDAEWPVVASGFWRDEPYVIYRNPTARPRAYVLPDDGEAGPIPATYESRDPDRVEVRATSTKPGALIVADTWMPGWAARLDDVPVPIRRVRGGQRMISLPSPGTHRVVMTYKPPGLLLGSLLTGVSMTAWAILGLVTLKNPLNR